MTSKSHLANSFTAVERWLSLRVFGRLPVTGVRGCTEAGVRKPLTDTADWQAFEATMQPKTDKMRTLGHYGQMPDARPKETLKIGSFS